MSIKTYEQLQKIVAPVLVNYHDDLRKHDYNILIKFDVPFVYGYRPTGTDLLLMLPQLSDYSWKRASTIEEKQRALKEDFLWIEYNGRNVYFLHFDGSRLRKKTLDELREIWSRHIDKIIKDSKNL